MFAIPHSRPAWALVVRKPESIDMTITFDSLGVPAELVRVLAADGKSEPFPIQAATLRDTLAGRDVLGRGKTGSGKTLAFSIPVVATLAAKNVRRQSGSPTGLILAPTRELATQIAAAITPLAHAAGLTVTTVFGGVKQTRQEEAFRRGVDIVVACPGRLEDLMKQRIVRLDRVEVTVLDEADHMADLGFLPGVTRILAATPADGQRLLFSATLDNGVDVLAKRFLHSPHVHSVDEASSPVAAMTHHVFEVASGEKNALVHELASGLGRRILFTRTKHHAKKLAKKLTADGIPAVDLHGNLSQAQRDRNLSALSRGDVRVLVATDVAARGVHVDDIELVVHVDPPAEHKAYLHRSGRTARAGNAGDVVTLCLPEQRRDLAQLLRKAAIKVAPQRVSPTSAEVVELVGEHAPFVTPAAPAAPQQKSRPQAKRGQGAGSSNRNGGGGRGRGRSTGERSQRGSATGERSARRGAGSSTTRSHSDRPQVRHTSSTGQPQKSSSGSADRAQRGRRRATRPQGVR